MVFLEAKRRNLVLLRINFGLFLTGIRFDVWAETLYAFWMENLLFDDAKAIHLYLFYSETRFGLDAFLVEMRLNRFFASFEVKRLNFAAFGETTDLFDPVSMANYLFVVEEIGFCHVLKYVFYLECVFEAKMNFYFVS